MSEIFAYLRVSSRSQNLARQLEDIKSYNIPEENIIIEKASGKNFIGRTEYKQLRKRLRKGDLLIVCSLDRLGRNYTETANEWDSLVKKGIDIEVIDMPILNTRNNENGLTGKLISDIVLKLLCYVGEKERLDIKERQKQGIQACLSANKPYGRPCAVVPNEFKKYYGNLPPKDIQKICGIKKSTYYKYASKLKQEV